MISQWLQPFPDIGSSPVNDRTLRQVGKILLDLGKLPIEHKSRADRSVLAVEPTNRLAAPLTLDLPPRWRLEEAHRGLGGVELAVPLGLDGPYRKSHR